MRNFLIVLLILVVALPLFAQPDIARWSEFNVDQWSAFYDIFATRDGGLAMCGTIGQMWMVKLDRGGAVDFTGMGGLVEEFSIASTIIEADGGGFLLGGRAGVHFAASKIDRHGGSDWSQKYTIGNRQGHCFSAIELKSGEFLMAGYVEAGNDRDGLLVMTDEDGMVLWSRDYGIGEFDEEIRAIKEIGENGVMVCAVRKNNTSSDLWILMIDYNGRINYESQLISNLFYYPEDMASVADGYGIGGTVVNEEGDTDYFVTKIDRVGAHRFTQRYSVEDGSLDRCRGIVGMPDGGFTLFGHTDGGDLPYKATRVRVGSGGGRMYDAQDEYRGSYAYYNSATANRDGAITYCGVLPSAVNWSYSMAFIAEGYGEENPPKISWKKPEADKFKVLVGDEVDFAVGIFDPDRDEVHTYTWWKIRNQWWYRVSQDSTVTILFDELGIDTVHVEVRDSLSMVSTRWVVDVTDFYISEHTPEPLYMLVERTDTLDFTLNVRYIHEGAQVPEYEWLVNGEFVSDQPLYRHPCSIPGDYYVTGIAHLGDEKYDEVNWLIRVKAIIGSWNPTDLALTVPRDTTVTFRAGPYGDSLYFNCLWTLNRRRVTRDTVAAITFPDLGHQRLVAATNIGLDIDRIEWDINVVPPESVGDDFAVLPSDPELTEIYPNPFNSSGRFTYSVPSAGKIKLQLFDMTGRLVKSMVNGFITPGRRTVRIDASAMPTGLYILYMEAAGTRITRKAVVMK